MADEEVQRRHHFSDFTKSQQQTLVAAAAPQKTKQATDTGGVFESFCREICVSVDVKTISASALADVLKKFYGGLTTKKGGTYQATSYLSARAAIQREVTRSLPLISYKATHFYASQPDDTKSARRVNGL